MKPEQYEALEAEVLAALRRAPGPEPSTELDARILARAKRRGGVWLRPSRLTAIAATVLVLAGGGVALRLAQQVDTLPPALQAPPAASAADQPEVEAPAATADRINANEDEARDASLGPVPVVIDDMAKRELSEERARLAAQRSSEAESARREEAAARAAQMRPQPSGRAVAPATPAPPAPPPPAVPPPAPVAGPAAKAASEPARMAEPFPATSAGAASKPATPPARADATAIGTTHSAEAGATLQDLEMADERKDDANTGAQALAEIRRLLAEGRRDAARARLAQLRAEDPEFLVPADLEMLLEGDAPD